MCVGVPAELAVCVGVSATLAVSVGVPAELAVCVGVSATLAVSVGVPATLAVSVGVPAERQRGQAAGIGGAPGGGSRRPAGPAEEPREAPHGAGDAARCHAAAGG